MCSNLTLWDFYHDLTPLFRWTATLLAIPVFTLSMLKYEGNEPLLICLIGLPVLLAGYNSENITVLLLSFTIVVGAKDIPFRDIIRVHLIYGLCFCLFNIVGRELDLVPQTNLIQGNEREGTFGDIVAREDFGYGYSTDFALHVFYILLDYWILKNRKLRWFEILVFVFFAYFVVRYSDARLAAICILFIVVLSSFFPLFQKRTFCFRYIINPFFIICIPLFAIISIGGTIMYDDTDYYWIGADLLFSNRLHIGQDAMQEAGISLFGQTYTMYGMGNLGVEDEYNYIDCSYLQSLVFWGVFLTVILVLLFVKICMSASVFKDYILLSAVFVAGISGIIAQFFYFLAYCPLLMALTAQLQDNDASESPEILSNSEMES